MKHFAKRGILFCLLLASSFSFAQKYEKRTPEERADRQTKWMENNLALTGGQRARVYDILLHYARKAEQATAQAPAGPDRRIERNEINRDKDAELKQVLTGDQFDKYLAHEREVKDRMMQRRNGG